MKRIILAICILISVNSFSQRGSAGYYRYDSINIDVDYAESIIGPGIYMVRRDSARFRTRQPNGWHWFRSERLAKAFYNIPNDSLYIRRQR